MSEGGDRSRFTRGDPVIVVVAAMGENRVIGRNGGLPWRIKSDLQHFRSLTWGKPVIMGRKTFSTLGRPLPGRTNIVLTRDRDFSAPGIVVATKIEHSVELARGDAFRRGTAEIIIAGGAEIYAQALPLADRMVLTLVHASTEGDTLFPAIDPDRWQEIERSEHPAESGDEARFAFVTYRRRSPIHATESRA